MTFKIAEVSGIDKVLELHYRYQVDSILEEDKRWFCNNSFYKRTIN